ncbi:MAG: RluA family pseudouridine synthase, partial [Planctomycetota bacterium]|nr:RluA family pseudouridine synthase [Planctomycetota bacterium]
QFLAQRFRYRDLDGWLEEIAAEKLQVDGRIASPTTRVQRGQSVTYTTEHREPEVDLEVPILFEDADLAVINKPALLPCHADGTFVRHTLAYQLRQKLGKVSLVHRLDRETSGIMLIARNRKTQRNLAEQFSQSAVEKTYLAVAGGQVDGDFTADGAIGLASDSKISLRRAVVADDAPEAQPARTDFSVVRALSDRTLLRCRPHTGRTHQIRVHLAAAGHPLLGDKLYGRSDEQYLEFVHHVKAGGSPLFSPDGQPGRQMLHATSLRFAHPTHSKPLFFEVDMPQDMQSEAPDDVGR